MAAELNILKLEAAPEARQAKQAAPASPSHKEEGEGFSSVLRRVSDESQERPKAQTSEKESSNHSENGLAAGKEKNLAGEEGSSRSASLSPKEPDQVEEPAASQPVSLETSEQTEASASNAGGELPFLTAIEDLFAQAPLEVPLAEGEELPALVLRETPVLVAAPARAAQIVDPAALAKAPVEAEAAFALDEALAQLEPVLGEKEIAKELPLPAPVAPRKAEGASLTQAEPELASPVLDRPKTAESLAENLLSGQGKGEERGNKTPFAPQSEDLQSEQGVSQPKADKSDRRETPFVFATKAGEVESKPALAKEIDPASAALEAKPSTERRRVEISVANAPESESKTDFRDLVREFQGIEKIREAKAPERPAPVESPRPLPGSVEDQVFRQIRMRIEPGVSQVDIRLLPPELGAVRIRFQLDGDRMTARVEAREASTAVLLERHLPELKSTMAEAGIDVKEIQISSGSFSSGLGLHKDQANEAEEDAQGRSGRFSKNGGRDGEEDENADGELVVSRAGGGIDYVI